ncbi:MAG: MBL fold metallo-hydrolase [Nitrososphaerales archaeon]
MILRTLPVGMLQVNCYILGSDGTREAIVIDPGDNANEIIMTLKRQDLNLVRILGTHGHFDHILGCRPLQELTAAPFYLHEADLPAVAAMQRTCQAWLGYDPGEPPEITGFLVPGEAVEVGDIRLEVRHTPGHSPGGVTLVDHANRRAFTGDALFAGSIGRTDFPGSSLKALLAGIREEILSLPDDYAVLSGHGPASTVGVERRTNPFLDEDAW